MSIKQYKKRYLKQLFEEGEKGAAGEGGQNGGQTTSGANTAEGGNQGNQGNQGNGGQGGNQDEKKYSDADLDKIINQRFERWQKQQQKAIEEAQKKAKLTESEKISELEKQLNELRAENARGNNGKVARQTLTAEGVTISLPDEIVDLLISDDAETTTNNAKTFAKHFKTAVAEGVKAALKSPAPPAGDHGAPTMTKEQIMKIKDPIERQKAIRANLKLFK